MAGRSSATSKVKADGEAASRLIDQRIRSSGLARGDAGADARADPETDPDMVEE
jgi:hypothetical protein